jgi:hypothetical protein
MQKFTREDVRKALVKSLQTVIPSNVRVQWPGSPQIDVSKDKNLFMTVRLVYMDSMSTDLGTRSNTRLMGIIEVTFNFKEGSGQDTIKFNNLADSVQNLLSNTDSIVPLRTYSTRQETARRGVNPQDRGSELGWVIESLVTPFWYDTEI